MSEPKYHDPPLETKVAFAAARAGCRHALGWLMERCRRYLCGIAERKLDPNLRAACSTSDLVQDTFLEGQQGFSRFRGDSIAGFRVWLRGILIHRLHGFVREHRPRSDSPEGQCAVSERNARTFVASPSERLAVAERNQRLDEALAKLPAVHRQVLLLRHRDGRPFADIAEVTHRSPEAARKLWWRSIKKLRQELQGLS